jgi:hypothetical protein
LQVFDIGGNSVSDEVIVTVVQAVVTTTTTTTTTTAVTTTTTTTTTATTTTTSDSTSPTQLDPMLLAGGGAGIVIILLVLVLMSKRKRPEKGPPAPVELEFPPTVPPTTPPTPVAPPIEPPPPIVSALRGGEIVGGKFQYKIKVKNDTRYVITNVITTIVAYPEDCMEIDGPTSKKIARIEPGGFRSPQFIFSPTKDCVEGEVLATVSYVDHENDTQIMKVDSYTIRSVCDLLTPLKTSVEEFDLMLGDMAVTAEDQTLNWNPGVLYQKAETMLKACNFYIMDSSSTVVGDQFRGEIRGLAKGKYTDKRVAVRLTISGAVDGSEARVEVEGLGDDMAMLPTTIDEITKGIDAWTCLNCGGGFEPDEVNSIRVGQAVQCRYCRKTMTIELYKKG